MAPGTAVPCASTSDMVMLAGSTVAAKVADGRTVRATLAAPFSGETRDTSGESWRRARMAASTQ